MAGLITLLALSAVMAIASFIAGMLPLSFSLSPSQLRLISTVGMGVLVGTSLIVIIPEGVETLYSASGASTVHKRAVSGSDSAHVWWAPDLVPRMALPLATRADPFDLPGPVIPEALALPPPTPTEPGAMGALAESAPAAKPSGRNGKEDHHGSSAHAWVGIALVAGFITMYLIDKIPQYMGTKGARTPTHHIALNSLGRRFNLTTSLDREEEADAFIDHAQTAEVQGHGFATTTGLVIHAAADGIALGASSSTRHNDLSLIIFFAIMIHKAPAAFALTSLLIKLGVSKRTARAHLVLFSLAAPTGAIATWLLAHVMGDFRGRTEQGTAFWTGILLLFSGGTFLYVAMHAMQETSNSHRESRMNGSAHSYVDSRDSTATDQKPSLKDLGAACFGMILPLFLQIGHAH
ncbi:hypothetical protein DV736_g6653, partial [Chaetothyriales sp. CBS 134916]